MSDSEGPGGTAPVAGYNDRTIKRMQLTMPHERHDFNAAAYGALTQSSSKWTNTMDVAKKHAKGLALVMLYDGVAEFLKEVKIWAHRHRQNVELILKTVWNHLILNDFVGLGVHLEGHTVLCDAHGDVVDYNVHLESIKLFRISIVRQVDNTAFQEMARKFVGYDTGEVKIHEMIPENMVFREAESKPPQSTLDYYNGLFTILKDIPLIKEQFHTLFKAIEADGDASLPRALLLKHFREEEQLKAWLQAKKLPAAGGAPAETPAEPAGKGATSAKATGKKGGAPAADGPVPKIDVLHMAFGDFGFKESDMAKEKTYDWEYVYKGWT